MERRGVRKNRVRFLRFWRRIHRPRSPGLVIRDYFLFLVGYKRAFLEIDKSFGIMMTCPVKQYYRCVLPAARHQPEALRPQCKYGRYAPTLHLSPHVVTAFRDRPRTASLDVACTRLGGSECYCVTGAHRAVIFSLEKERNNWSAYIRMYVKRIADSVRTKVGHSVDRPRCW